MDFPNIAPELTKLPVMPCLCEGFIETVFSDGFGGGEKRELK
jgi:hypothetical protein